MFGPTHTDTPSPRFFALDIPSSSYISLLSTRWVSIQRLFKHRVELMTATSEPVLRLRGGCLGVSLFPLPSHVSHNDQPMLTEPSCKQKKTHWHPTPANTSQAKEEEPAYRTTPIGPDSNRQRRTSRTSHQYHLAVTRTFPYHTDHQTISVYYCRHLLQSTRGWSRWRGIWRSNSRRCRCWSDRFWLARCRVRRSPWIGRCRFWWT